MASMEIGSNAKVIAPVVQGVIVDTEYHKETRQLRHLLQWTDATGDHNRWFLESELEAANAAQ